MVDMEMVWGELKRTAYTGVGVFASAQTGDFLEELLPGSLGALGIGAAQYGVGTAGAIVAQSRMNAQDTRGFNISAGEFAKHASYGVGATGFDEGARAFRGQTGASGSASVVEVERNVGQSAETREEEEEFMLENA